VPRGQRRRIPLLVGLDDRARRLLPRWPGDRLAATCRRGDLPAVESEQQLFLCLHCRPWSAPGGRCAGIALGRLPPNASANARDGHRSRLHLLALHGWLVGFSVSTSPSGTVKRERYRTRGHSRITLVRRRIPVCSEFKEAGDVVVHRLRLADLFGLAPQLRLCAALNAGLAPAV